MLLSRAQCSWRLGKIGAAEHPPSVRAAKIPREEEGRVRFRSWRAKGGREERDSSTEPPPLVSGVLHLDGENIPAPPARDA